jgi:hypothetical protein
VTQLVRSNDPTEDAPAGTIGRLLVEATDPNAALSLVEQLRGLHSELLPGPGDHCQVRIDFEHGRETQIAAALAAIERWLEDVGLAAVKVKLSDRSYVLERRAAVPVTGRISNVEQ